MSEEEGADKEVDYLRVNLYTMKSAGWNDYCNGIPFRYDIYLHFPCVLCMAYESGRLLAANVKCAGIEPPKWDFGTPMPQNVYEMSKLAHDRVGPAVCDERPYG